MSVIYLDYNRTTPLAPSVLEAMQPYWATHFMLPGQNHPHAQAVAEALEQAREGCAELVGCDPFELVFTSGGTESNNLAVLGILAKREPGHLLISAIEHDSVFSAAASLSSSGWDVETIPCGETGVVDPAAVEAALQDNTVLVCLQAANGVLGTIQPVREVADICHHRGVMLHCDATQTFGKMHVDARQLRADTIAISGHKFYGPKGSGALFIRRGLHVAPIAYGEPREMALRPGAENIPACVGLGTAAMLAARCSTEASNNLSELTDRFIAGLCNTITPAPHILCRESRRLPNTIAIEMGGDAKRIQRAARQIVVATAQSAKPPDEITRIVRAIGCDDAAIERVIRISLGWTTSREQIDRAVDILAEACDGAVI